MTDSGVSYPVGRFPLTPMQSGMLYHQVRGSEQGQGFDLEQLVIRTSEEIVPEAFTRAAGLLLSRHPVLRTRFIWNSGEEPMQEIAHAAEPMVEWVDCETVAESAREHDFQFRLVVDRERGMDLSRVSPVRLNVFRYGAGETRILLTVHHAVVDGRSFAFLLEDLFALYESEIGVSASLPFRANSDFREFVAWQAWNDFETQSGAFWKEQLAGFTAPTPLMVNDLPDVPKESAGWQKEVALSQEETRVLEGLAELSLIHI